MGRFSELDILRNDPFAGLTNADFLRWHANEGVFLHATPIPILDYSVCGPVTTIVLCEPPASLIVEATTPCGRI